MPASHFQLLGDFTPIQVLELFLPTCLLLLGNQSMYQKFFSAKTERDASRAVIGWIIGTVILETVIIAIAVTGSALFPTGEVAQSPREILAYVGLHAFGNTPSTITLASTYAMHLLGALLMGAIFAKVISTANNWLFSPATNLVNDIYVRYLQPEASNKRILIVSRLMVVLLGLWALYQGLHAESVLKKALYAYTIYGAALTPVILAAFYWRRATAAGAVSSIAAGTVITVAWESIHGLFPPAIANRDAIFPALVVSLLCLFVVSLLTPKPDLAHLQSLGEG